MLLDKITLKTRERFYIIHLLFVQCLVFIVNVAMVPEDNTYYAQKICLSGADRLCAGRPGAFDGEQLSSPSERSKNVSTITKRLSTTTGEICMEHCVNEKDFPCR